jgi:hypothetical protein
VKQINQKNRKKEHVKSTEARDIEKYIEQASAKIAK